MTIARVQLRRDQHGTYTLDLRGSIYCAARVEGEPQVYLFADDAPDLVAWPMHGRPDRWVVSELDTGRTAADRDGPILLDTVPSGGFTRAHVPCGHLLERQERPLPFGTDTLHDKMRRLRDAFCLSGDYDGYAVVLVPVDEHGRRRAGRRPVVGYTASPTYATDRAEVMQRDHAVDGYVFGACLGDVARANDPGPLTRPE